MSNIKDRVKHYIRRALDRPGGRAVLALLMRIRIRQKHGVSARVEWHPDGYWIFRYPEAAVPAESLFLDRLSPREKEEETFDLFFQEYLPGPGDIILDLGAELGTEVNLLSRLVGPDGHVYSIEAHPTTFQWLKRRCDASGLTNVTPVNVAISDAPGSVWISDVGDALINRLTDEPTGFEIPAVSLDDFIEEHQLERVDLLKVNIEGAERLAVKGMDRSAHKIAHIAIQCHDFLAEGDDDWYRTEEDVRKALTAMDFDIVERRSEDRRDFARGWLYGSRKGDGNQRTTDGTFDRASSATST